MYEWSSISSQKATHIFTDFTVCPSGPDTEWNIQWPITNPDTTVSRPCPGDLDSASGMELLTYIMHDYIVK